MKNTIQTILDKKSADIIELEKYLYDNPEIEMEEFKAKDKFISMLEAEGFTVEKEISGLPTAFVAHKDNGVGPKIGFLAEYDALPGMGHACGHNLIGGIGYGCAVILGEMLKDHDGSVYIFGTPAEETGRGKPKLIEDGYFNNVDVAIMAHPMKFHGLDSNLINLEGYDITFHGKASHAGEAPSCGVNALDAAIVFYTSIAVMRQQIRDGARIHGIITDGGKAPNIIPDKASLRIEIREENLKYFRELVTKVHAAANAAAIATGCSVDIEMYEPPICCMKNNKVLLKLFKEHLLESGVAPEEIIDHFVTGGCTDMGNVSQVVPSIHPWFKMVRSDSEAHTVEFLKDAGTDDAAQEMLRCIKCLTEVGLDILTNPALLDSIKKDFQNK